MNEVVRLDFFNETVREMFSSVGIRYESIMLENEFSFGKNLRIEFLVKDWNIGLKEIEVQ